MRGLVREQRQAPVHLHRVYRNDLSRDTLSESFRDGRLAARGRTENGDHESAHDATILAGQQLSRWSAVKRFLTRTHLEHGRRALAAFVIGAGVLSLAALVGVASAAGFDAVWDDLRHVS